MKTITLAAALLTLSATTASADCLASWRTIGDRHVSPSSGRTGGCASIKELRRPRALSPARRSARHVGQAAGRARHPPLKARQPRQDASGRARTGSAGSEGLCLVPALWRASQRAARIHFVPRAGIVPLIAPLFVQPRRRRRPSGWLAPKTSTLGFGRWITPCVDFIGFTTRSDFRRRFCHRLASLSEPGPQIASV